MRAQVEASGHVALLATLGNNKAVGDEGESFELDGSACFAEASSAPL